MLSIESELEASQIRLGAEPAKQPAAAHCSVQQRSSGCTAAQRLWDLAGAKSAVDRASPMHGALNFIQHLFTPTHPPRSLPA